MKVQPQGRRRSIGGTLLYVLFLLLFTLVALEIILRIYNPFHFTVKGDQITLPANQRLIINNSINPKLDREVINTRNSLGFRGSEPPNTKSFKRSIITVGGSTTECHFLSDDHTWPALLAAKLKPEYPDLWLNNAGLDGHSSFGHIILLNDYLVKLQPRVLIFLMGINDVENEGFTFHDKMNVRGAYPDLKHYIFNHSEVLSLALNIVRGWRAQRLNNTTNHMAELSTLGTLMQSDSVAEKRIALQARYVDAYKKRIITIIDTCRAHHILPVFLTQPNLFGAGIDSISHIDLALAKLEPELNGELLWKMLEQYNVAMKTTCIDQKVDVIDLATAMPKNSLYFYDASHFTNQGAEKVSEIVAAALEPMLRRNAF